jgi:hypothetical protein
VGQGWVESYQRYRRQFLLLKDGRQNCGAIQQGM